MTGLAAVQRRFGGPLGAARQVAHQAMRDDVPGLAAELAYRFFLSMFPFAIFLTAMGAFIARELALENPAGRVVALLANMLPPEAAALVQGELERIIASQDARLLSLGAVLALFFASGGMHAIIKALNRAYKVPEARPTWRRYIVATVLTLVAGGSVITAFVLYVPVRLVAAEVVTALGFGQFASLAVNVIAGLAALLLMIAAAAFIYRVAPNIKLPVRSVLPGAILFAICWLVTTFGFAYYVTHFGNYANTYGALAGVAITLIWFYVSSLILLVAAEVNEVIHERRHPADVEKRRVDSEREARRHQAAQGQELEQEQDQEQELLVEAPLPDGATDLPSRT